MNNLVTIENNQVVASSRDIAVNFKKSHKNVLQSIENLDIPTEFNQLNFQPVEYTDLKGEKRKSYSITRDGMSLLVMGFTGRRAMDFKLKYINVFNEMEKTLLENTNNIRGDLTPLVTALNNLIDSRVQDEVLRSAK